MQRREDMIGGVVMRSIVSDDQLRHDAEWHEHQRRSAIRQALDSLVVQGVLTRAEADERYHQAIKRAEQR